MTDWELIQQHLAGYRAAMETLIRRHADFVYATATRLTSSADAPDVTQAVFILLTKKAPKIPHRGTLIGWLHHTTRLCAANLRRIQSRRRRHEREAAMSRPESIPAAIPSDLSAHLDAALTRLSPPDRDVLLLHFLQNKTYAEAATELSTTEEAARKRATRALEKLRTLLTPRIELSALTPLLAMHAAVNTPPTLLATVAALPHGAPMSAAATSLATAVSRALQLAKLQFISFSLAAILLFAAGAFALVHRAPAAAPAPVVAAIPASAPDISQPALPEVTLAAADLVHPTEAEVKTFLQARLDRLANITVHYTVHTEYPAPPTGWPKISPPPAAAAPPTQGRVGPAFIGNHAAAEASYSTIYVFPSGSSDVEKAFSRLNDSFRYDRSLLEYTPAVPFLEGVYAYQSQSAVYTPDFVEHLYDSRYTRTANDNYPPAFPTTDIETALLLTYYLSTTGSGWHRSPVMNHLVDPDELAISFPDPQYILVSRIWPLHPSRISSAPTRPTTRTTVAPEAMTWTLDRNLRCAPVSFTSTNNGLRMEMSDFRPIGGLMIPHKIVSTFATSTAPQSPADFWQKDTLTVTGCRIQDPANTSDRYNLKGDGTPPRTPALNNQLSFENLEIGIGAEAVQLNSLVHMNPAFSEATPALGSPSTPACRNIPRFFAAHDRFLARAKQGHIDTLLVGDDFAQHWSDDPATWQKLGDAARTANFGLDGDTLDNILWRINHGELDHVAPKNILLFAGNTDAANFGRGNAVPSIGRPGVTNYSFTHLGGVQIRWLPREDPPADIAAGTALLAKTIHQKCPTARLFILSLPPRTYLPFPSTPRKEPTLNPRIPQINTAISTLPDTKFSDLSPASLEDDVILPPHVFDARNQPPATLYTQWTSTLLKSLQQ